MISWPSPCRDTDVAPVSAADASLANANDNPAAAPSTGMALLRRLRFEDFLACDTEVTFQCFRFETNRQFPVSSLRESITAVDSCPADRKTFRDRCRRLARRLACPSLPAARSAGRTLAVRPATLFLSALIANHSQGQIPGVADADDGQQQKRACQRIQSEILLQVNRQGGGEQRDIADNR
jgi:hypothetical protein